MSDRAVPAPGTTWDQIGDIWDEVREIVMEWEGAQPAGEPEG
ncbi:hypothetical protein Sme01_52930 [Sphaerisporangium melleum]|uniref:Uncharacterized protein n=1 Tax=Sphaerisporangium melleum TaxID=321316 RepID=A0A917VJN0_9ACTN|nr:hypothetical protein [Sphaerisporangium melleum]GGK90826.1 hypothetical protein GCM10007964_36810 [Sphaerisporangium melleum]GII72817.1 hypothetical protein Sme01_52930 [Sphaerisporangium melleum]